MVLHVLRALFILLMAAAGWIYLSSPTSIGAESSWLALPIMLTVGVLFVCFDILTPRRKFAVLSGTVLGLMVGMSVSYGLSFIVQFLIDQVHDISPTVLLADQLKTLGYLVKTVVGVICCYLTISFVLQTKDDFRFIIPYVEFAKQAKGPRPILLDTSVLIDGRVGDIASTGIFEDKIIVPQFVLEELQAVADSPDKLKRSRGKRGLDVLTKMRADKRIDVTIYESPRYQEAVGEVDQKLVRLAKELHGRVVTNDHNLNKVAKVSGVDVINIHDLALALKPVILPGEKMSVRIIRAGEGPGQGVGYLEDGTMVVVEHAKESMGEEVQFTVTRSHQSSAGRMIFGRAISEAVAVGEPQGHAK